MQDNICYQNLTTGLLTVIEEQSPHFIWVRTSDGGFKLWHRDAFNKHHKIVPDQNGQG